MRWMNLETIIQSEANQKEKGNYRILMHGCGIQKEATDESLCRAAMETQTLGRVDPTGGGREDGQGGMNGGSNKETSTTVCKPDRPWEVPI